MTNVILMMMMMMMMILLLLLLIIIMTFVLSLKNLCLKISLEIEMNCK